MNRYRKVYVPAGVFLLPKIKLMVMNLGLRLQFGFYLCLVNNMGCDLYEYL